MSIKIENDLCIGCQKCVEVCPGSLIVCKRGETAAIPRPERCWACASCIKECPVQAILLFLGEDMGGLGGCLTVKQENNFLYWTIQKPDHSVQAITINLHDANKY